MLKIAAVIPGGDFVNRRGLMNAALARVSNLEKYSEFKFDTYAIKIDYRLYHFGCLVTNSYEKSTIEVDGRIITVLTKVEYRSPHWLSRKFLKAYYRMSSKLCSDWEWQKDFARYFKGYDIITAHFNDAAIAAEAAHRRYGIPYFVTWHGSDIHTIPFKDERAMKKTRIAIENAKCNFFVSNALMEASEAITKRGKKDILYNGVDTKFEQYEKDEIIRLRSEFGVEKGRVITFAGNLLEIKNAQLLPDIFQSITSHFCGVVHLWIIGEGQLRPLIERRCQDYGLNCKFWGNQPHEFMPAIFNCTDILVLPSKNEGLPLVALEAIACGANVVGTRVGGIPEVIGDEFCVGYDKDIVESIGLLASSLLTSPKSQKLSPRFSWKESALKEISYFRDV